MTVASAVARNDYLSSGITGPYTFTFPIQAASHLVVAKRDLATGGETTLTQGVDYTLAGTSWANGGNFTLAASLASGYAITARRVVPLTQLVDLRNQGAFFAEVHESEFDLLVEADQQQQDQLDRALKLPTTEAGTAANSTLPAAALRANKALVFDASGNPTVAAGVSASSIPDVSLMQVVDSIAALKALAVPAGAVQYYVRGYYAANDGGGGVFRWDSASASADNRGTVIIPNSAPGTGRWRRMDSSTDISIRCWGAKIDGVTDDYLAWQSALDSVPNTAGSYAPGKGSGGAGRITITCPNGDSIVSATLDCSQRDYVRIIGDGRTNIISTATGSIIDMASADHCEVIGVQLYSSTAARGILLDRCTSNPYCMFNVFRNVRITLGTNAAANGGQGTVALYNCRGEQNVFENLHLIADVPYWARNTYNATIAPAFGTQNTAITSGTVCTHIQCNFVSNGPLNYSIILEGAVSFEFINCYWSQGVVNAGSIVTAIYMINCNRCRFSGSVEVLTKLMNVVGIAYGIDIDIAMQVVDATGVITMNTANANGFVNSDIAIVYGGATAGSIVKDNGTAPTIQLLGNRFRGPSILSAFVVTGVRQVDNNIVQSDSGLAVTASAVKSNTLQGTTGVTASTASGTPVTLIATAAGVAYRVIAYILGGSTPFFATAIVLNDGTGTGILNYSNGANMSLTISGSNIQATQTSGSAQVIQYKIFKLI